MKILKKIGHILIAILVSVIGIIEIVVRSVIPLWGAAKSGTVWFGIFYQPFVVLIAAIPLVSQIEIVFTTTNGRLFWIVLLTFEAIALTFAINTLVELIFNLFEKENVFAEIQEMQRYSNNYALIIISLIALYVATFSTNSQTHNFGLLLCGILFFVSTVSSDAYRTFIYCKGSVNDLAIKIKQLIKQD